MSFLQISFSIGSIPILFVYVRNRIPLLSPECLQGSSTHAFLLIVFVNKNNEASDPVRVVLAVSIWSESFSACPGFVGWFNLSVSQSQLEFKIREWAQWSLRPVLVETAS